jgi:hypothetical protein
LIEAIEKTVPGVRDKISQSISYERVYRPVIIEWETKALGA